ncbi:hypothetical protein [Persephonella sp.]|uniref:hypothetical protein n=1 Tax=Persephonella sp. TaxID=2060922 RepID=UPI0025E5BE1A|nr:hypothetical protein [Persephonella sp.]
MHISKIYGKGLYHKKAKKISKGKDIFASIFESMGKSDKRKLPQKTSADKNLFQTTPSSVHLNLKEHKLSKKQKEAETQSPEKNSLDKPLEDLSFGKENIYFKETVENNLKRGENKKINIGSGKKSIKNPEVYHNFHYKEAFVRGDFNRKFNSHYSLLQPELIQSGTKSQNTIPKISKPQTIIQKGGKSAVVYEHVKESTPVPNFSTSDKKTKNIPEKNIPDKNNNIFEGIVKEVPAEKQHSEKIGQNSDTTFVKQEKVSAGIPLYSFFSAEKGKTPADNPVDKKIDKKNSRIKNLINTEHSHKGKIQNNQKGTEHISTHYPEQIKEEPTVQKKEVDTRYIADMPSKNNKFEPKPLPQPTDKVNFRPDGISKNQDVAAFSKEKPKPSKDQPLEKKFNLENLEDLKQHKRSVKERLTNSSKITAFGRQNENKKTLEKNLQESQQSDKTHVEKPDLNFILSSSSEKLDLKAEKQPKSEINHNTSIQNVSNQKFSESSQDFSGKQHNQQAQTDKPLEDSSRNFDNSFNRNLTLNLKFGDINLTARYIRNKMDLFLVMHSTTNQSLHSMRDEISHIIQDSGIEEYFVKIKTRDRELNYSSDIKKSDKKNRGLHREINVKV